MPLARSRACRQGRQAAPLGSSGIPLLNIKELMDSGKENGRERNWMDGFPESLCGRLIGSVKGKI